MQRPVLYKQQIFVINTINYSEEVPPSEPSSGLERRWCTALHFIYFLAKRKKNVIISAKLRKKKTHLYFETKKKLVEHRKKLQNIFDFQKKKKIFNFWKNGYNHELHI